MLFLWNGPAVLDSRIFEEGTTDRRFADVVSAEIEAYRSAHLARENAGDSRPAHPRETFLASSFRLAADNTPVHFADADQWSWFDILSSLGVLERSARKLQLTVEELLTWTLEVLLPPNYDTFIRIARDLMEREANKTWIRDEVEKSLAEQVRRHSSLGGASRADKLYGPARAFVLKQWNAEKDAYEGKKAPFARDYMPRVKREFGVDVTDKTIAQSWLKGM